MINLRYHIVSLTAVFLALGIGVLLGGTYLDKYTVDQLDQSISNAETRIRDTNAENDRLRGELGDADARNRALLDAGTTQLFRGQLVDVPVLVISAEGTDETVRRNLVRAVSNSGADFRGTLTVTAELEDLDEAKAAAVAEALDLDASTPSAVRSDLVDQFGGALASAGSAVDTVAPGDGTTTTVAGAPDPGATTPDGSTTTAQPPATTAPTDPGSTVPGGPTTTVPQPEPPQQPAVLTVMLDQGLLAFEAPTSPSESGPLLSEQGYRLLFLSDGDAAVADDAFLVPVLRRMADAGPVPVVVATSTPSDDDEEGEEQTVVTVTRGDAELSRLVSTVDNVESFNGVAASILALDEIGRGARGHYGEGRGSAAPIPSGA